MMATRPPWDYLIVTASNHAQAEAYRRQLLVRRQIGLLADFGEVLVLGDPREKRVGSGGSTLYCLLEVLNRELPRSPHVTDWLAIEETLRRLRILILHAGGDSRRLPAYGPCGKIFVPVPVTREVGAGGTVFEHLLHTFVPFPATPSGSGQVVVAAGDALLRFDPTTIQLAERGLTALGCYASPEECSKHGVFCAHGSGPVWSFLQKPSPAQQASLGAINPSGDTILDIGVMSFDAETAAALLRVFEIAADANGRLAWSPIMEEMIFTRGLDLYREICCALGTEATAEHLVASAGSSGSTWDEGVLRRLYEKLRPIALAVHVVKQCGFLHFGTTRQLIESGLELLRQTGDSVPPDGLLMVNNTISPGGTFAGYHSWVEGCRLSASLSPAGQNVVLGVDVDEPLALPQGACLDVLAGHDRRGRPVWFVRCYGVNDTFKDSVAKGATLCGRPLMDFLAAVGIKSQDVWDGNVTEKDRSLWNARVFPAVAERADYRQWLWTFDSATPSEDQKHAFSDADRYSVAEMAFLADQEAFYERRSFAKPQAACH
jgi:fucokinase